MKYRLLKSLWKEKEFSVLAKLACNYLMIPASSAPVEGLFSVAGKLFRPERSSVSDARFEELMTILCNPNVNI